MTPKEEMQTIGSICKKLNDLVTRGTLVEGVASGSKINEMFRAIADLDRAIDAVNQSTGEQE